MNTDLAHVKAAVAQLIQDNAANRPGWITSYALTTFDDSGKPIR